MVIQVHDLVASAPILPIRAMLFFRNFIRP